MSLSQQLRAMKAAEPRRASLRLVMFGLADEANDAGVAEASLAQLMVKTACGDRRTMQRRIRRLEEAGLVRVEHRDGEENLYHLWPDNPADNPDGGGGILPAPPVASDPQGGGILPTGGSSPTGGILPAGGAASDPPPPHSYSAGARAGAVYSTTTSKVASTVTGLEGVYNAAAAAGLNPLAVLDAVLARGFEGPDAEALVRRDPVYAAAMCRRMDEETRRGFKRTGGWLARGLRAGNWRTSAQSGPGTAQMQQDSAGTGRAETPPAQPRPQTSPPANEPPRQDRSDEARAALAAETARIMEEARREAAAGSAL